MEQENKLSKEVIFIIKVDNLESLKDWDTQPFREPCGTLFSHEDFGSPNQTESN